MNRVPLGILVFAIFLMPIMGGAIVVDPLPMTGPESWLAVLQGGAGVATMSHALLFLLVGVAAVLGFLRQRVIVLPQNRILFLVLALAGFFVLSGFFSQFKFATLGSTVYFLSILFTFLVSVALLGRIEGPKLAMGALSAGTSVIAALGIREYAVQVDPNWRIFSLWIGPNALAGMLVIGIFCAIGTMLTSDRLGSLLSGLAVLLNGCALLLTGSKGGLVALTVGTVGLILFLLIGRAGLKATGYAAVAIVLGLGMATLLSTKQRQQQTNPGAAPVSRVLDSGGTSEQSAGFRTLLWKGALPVISAQPLGTGLGTYRYHSAKSGLTTITQTAHSSYVQLAVESGGLAVVCLLGLGLLVLREMMRGVRAQPRSLMMLKAGAFAAILASATHNAFDSDLYSAGSAMGLMVLLAVGLALSVDCTVPELAQKAAKGSFLGAFVLVPVALWLGRVEMSHAQFLGAAGAQNAGEAMAILGGLEGLASSDPRTSMAKFRVAAGKEESGQMQIALLQKAIADGPTPVMFRTLARIQLREGDVVGARETLQKGLLWDPNNLFILRQWLDMETVSNPDAAVAVARRLVAVEETPYFKIRSLPEFVATQTYDARVYLAEKSVDPAEKRQLLLPAVDGYAEYARVTVPKIVQFVKGGFPGGFGGEDPEKASRTLELGRVALAAAEKVKQPEDAQRLAVAGEALGAAARLLSESK